MTQVDDVMKKGEAQVMKPEEIASIVWAEIDRLRHEIPPPDSETSVYPDDRAVKAFQAADQAIASLCAVPRDDMLRGFTLLVEGSRMDDLLDALVASYGHPALRHSCLMVMCGVTSLKKAHDTIAKRHDVLKTLLAALAAPRPFYISPEGWEETICVNSAVGAAICLNSLLVSTGGSKDETAKRWLELDGLLAITGALEAHEVFQGGGDEDVLPAMLFGLASPLLLYMSRLEAPPAAKKEANKEGGDGASKANRTEKPAQGADETKDAKKALSVQEKKKFDLLRQRLADAFLRLLAERREWLARSLVMAANTTPANTSGELVATPVPVGINNLFVNSLGHPDLLGRFAGSAPVRLRAQAVAASRKCEEEGKFARGFAGQLAQLLGLAAQGDKQRRMAGAALDKVMRKQASRVPVVTCARPSCGKREEKNGKGNKFKVCSRCQAAFYCSGECQAAHWREGHKRQCKKK